MGHALRVREAMTTQPCWARFICPFTPINCQQFSSWMKPLRSSGRSEYCHILLSVDNIRIVQFFILCNLKVTQNKF